jgi:hypothetical protein
MTRKRMTDDELLSEIEHLEAQANKGRAEVTIAQTKAMKYYLGAKMGNEEDGRSQVVSSDVWDVVEGLTPLVLKPFVASDDVVRFNPLSADDEEAAKQESDYVNWVVTQRNDAFNNLVTWVKAGLILKNGTAKWWWEKSRKATVERYFGLTDDMFALIGQDKEVEITEHTEHPGEPMEQMDPMTGQPVLMEGPPTHDVTIRVVEDVGIAKWGVLPPEEFLISRGATSPNPQDATFCQHRRMVTLSNLREMGYDVEDDIADQDSDDPAFSELAQARRGDDGLSNEVVSAASREVLFKETFLDIDRDGDGIAELRKVCSVGKTILSDDETEEKPFASWTPYPQPFSFDGRCPADETIEIQDVKTTLWRQGLDNIYTINNNRVYVSDKVNLDDLIDNQIAGIVRVDGVDVGRHVVPAEVTPIGQIIQPMIEYLDSAKENRTGFTRYNQGTDSDSLNKTATGIRIIKQAGDSRVELVSRAFAEQGLANVMRGVHGLCRRHATKAETMRLRGNWVDIDPRGWKTRVDMTVSVGLGTADQQMQLQGIQMLRMEQKEMYAAKVGIVSEENLYNSAKKMAEIVGHKNPEQFFTSPEKMPQKPDPTQDPGFQLELMKVKGDIDVRNRDVAVKEMSAKVSAAEVMKPEAGAPDTSRMDMVKLRLEAANSADDRSIEWEIAQLNDRTERWKAQMERATKLDIAQIQAKTKAKAE